MPVHVAIEALSDIMFRADSRHPSLAELGYSRPFIRPAEG